MRATDGQVRSFRIEDTADPLKKLVRLQTQGDVSGSCYHPLCNIVHGFGKANDCVVERVRREHEALVIEVLTKRRLGREMNRNPFLLEEKHAGRRNG